MAGARSQRSKYDTLPEANRKDQPWKYPACFTDATPIKTYSNAKHFFSFESAITGTNYCYVVYTDNSVDEEGSTNTYAGRIALGITPKVKGDLAALPLEQIESSEEWDLIEGLLERISNDKPE